MPYGHHLDELAHKAARAAYMRAWYDANPDKYAAHLLRCRRYRLTHREEVAACRRRWKKNNPQRVREGKRRYRAVHRKEILAKKHIYNVAAAQAGLHRKYWAEHRESCLAAGRRWRKNHPDAARALVHGRRARIRGNGGTYSIHEWKAACDAWGNRCLCCGALDGLTVDHVVPISRGGKNIIDNLQLLCMKCNKRKNIASTDYRPCTSEGRV